MGRRMAIPTGRVPGSVGRWFLAAIALVFLALLGIVRLRRGPVAPGPGSVLRKEPAAGVLPSTMSATAAAVKTPDSRFERPAGQATNVLPVGPKVAGERVVNHDRKKDPLEEDPGPGPYIEQYRGRSGQLSPHAGPFPGPTVVKNASSAKGPELVAWAAPTRLMAGQPAIVRATLVDSSGHPANPDQIEIRIAPKDELSDEVRSPMSASPSADSHFQYTFGLARMAREAGGKAAAPPQQYEFVVHATGTLDGSRYDRSAGGFFLVQRPGASLDASSARTVMSGGNLELEIVMHVEEKGAYFVMAELWGGQDGITPIAFGRERLGDVPTGDRKTTLLFGGQVIRDSGVDGPYVVRNVTLSRVSTLPPHQAEPIASLPSTPPFRANDFY